MKIIFIGGGVSCISLICYWIREKKEWLKQQTILIIEKQDKLGIGDLGNYKIRSNSVLPAFRSIIPSDIHLDPLLEGILNNIGQDYAPLGIVAEMLSGVAQSILNQYNNVTAKMNTECFKITNKTVHLFPTEKIVGDHIISSTGATQTIPFEYSHYNSLTSGEVLTGSHDFTNKKIAIIGASHSAWSVVWTLLKNYTKPFGSIDIFSRHKTRVFFRTRQEAILEQYAYTESEICPETNQIHRFGGLRGDSKQIWRNQHLYPNINHTIALNIPDLSAFDVVIIAYNYKRREIEGSSLKFGFMSQMECVAGEKSFKGSKDGIWLFSNNLAKKITELM